MTMTKPMIGVGDTAPGKPGLRGPAPPYSVCKECGAQSEMPWVNPLLEAAKRFGYYDGETTGGYVLCESPCVQRVEERLSKKQRQAWAPGVPKHMQDARLGNFDQKPTNREAFTAARAFLNGGEQDLLFCGPPGVGKTRLAATVANECYVKHGSVLFVRVPWMLTELQEAMHSEHEPAKLSDYVNPAVLVLDDLGVEKGSDYSRRMLTTLYDRRMDLGRRTIWTTNASIQDFLESADDRLGSRLAGGADVIYIDGEDRRVESMVERAERRNAAAHANRSQW